MDCGELKSTLVASDWNAHDGMNFEHMMGIAVVHRAGVMAFVPDSKISGKGGFLAVDLLYELGGCRSQVDGFGHDAEFRVIGGRDELGDPFWFPVRESGKIPM